MKTLAKMVWVLGCLALLSLSVSSYYYTDYGIYLPENITTDNWVIADVLNGTWIWTYGSSWPSACPTGKAVGGIGTTLSCIDLYNQSDAQSEMVSAVNLDDPYHQDGYTCSQGTCNLPPWNETKGNMSYVWKSVWSANATLLGGLISENSDAISGNATLLSSHTHPGTYLNYTTAPTCDAGDFWTYDGSDWSCDTPAGSGDMTSVVFDYNGGLDYNKNSTSGEAVASLRPDCSESQILKNQSGGWMCADDSSGGGGDSAGWLDMGDYLTLNGTVAHNINISDGNISIVRYLCNDTSCFTLSELNMSVANVDDIVTNLSNINGSVSKWDGYDGIIDTITSNITTLDSGVDVLFTNLSAINASVAKWNSYEIILGTVTSNITTLDSGVDSLFTNLSNINASVAKWDNIDISLGDSVQFNDVGGKIYSNISLSGVNITNGTMVVGSGNLTFLGNESRIYHNTLDNIDFDDDLRVDGYLEVCDNGLGCVTGITNGNIGTEGNYYLGNTSHGLFQNSTEVWIQ